MKPLFKCDWCNKTGTEEEIKEHEQDCTKNETLRSCFTCIHRKGWEKDFTSICGMNKELEKGKYMMYCEDWEQKELEPTRWPFDNVWDSFFGGFKD